MFHRLAVKWANSLVNHGAEKENLDVMIYGFECALNEITATILVFAIAFIIGKPLEMLVWQMFWLPFRVNLGGHHASSHLWCIVYSTALAVGCVLLVPLLTLYSWIIWIEIIFSILIAFTIAPVVHPNRQTSDARRIKFKKYGRIICLIETGIIVVAFFLPIATWFAQCAAIGMSSAALLCLIGKFTNPKAVTM